MKVWIGEVFSPELPVCRKVLQGSVLGPLQLLIYINYQSASITSNCWLFAFDVKLICTSKGTATFLQKLGQIFIWDIQLNVANDNIFISAEMEHPLWTITRMGSPFFLA